MSALGASVIDARVVDLFAGSGALGLEALSRGASSVTFVERGRGALRILRSNIELLDVSDRCTVADDDAIRFLRSIEEPFDLAFADPPYDTGDAGHLVQAFQAEPFAKELWLEHRWREQPPLPDGARTRRYGDTALTTLTAET